MSFCCSYYLSLYNFVDYMFTRVSLCLQRYNAPTTSQVAAIWTEGNDPQRCFDRSVLVYATGDRALYIKPYQGCYDPLSYPLYNPGGQTGWNKFMPYTDAPIIPATTPRGTMADTPTSMQTLEHDPTGLDKSLY